MSLWYKITVNSSKVDVIAHGTKHLNKCFTINHTQKNNSIDKLIYEVCSRLSVKSKAK